MQDLQMRIIPKHRRDEYSKIYKIGYPTIKRIRKVGLFIDKEDNDFFIQ